MAKLSHRWGMWLWLQLGAMILLALAISPVIAAGEFTLHSDQNHIALGDGHLSYLRDTSTRMTVDEAIAALHAGQFTPLAGNLGLGFTRDAVWLATTLYRRPETPEKWVLRVEPPTLDVVELYQIDSGQRPKQVSGDGLPVSRRALFHRSPTFDLTLAEGRTWLLLRIETTSQVTAIPFLSQESAFTRDNLTETLLLGLYFGALWAVLVYNFVIGFSVRQSLYFLYCLLVLSHALFWLAFDGLFGLLLLPEQPVLANQILAALLGIATFLGNYFYARALEVGPGSRRSLALLRLTYLVALASTVSVFFGALPYLLPLLLASLLLSVSVLGYHALRQVREGHIEQQIFGASYIVYATTVVITVLMNLSLLPANPWTAYSAQFGQFIHVLALHLGLYFRVRTKERLHAEIQLELAQATLARKRELEQINRTLEARVTERTQALAEANRELEQLARQDVLTGLPNRRAFNDLLETEFARMKRTGLRYALIMIDIDHFKQVNDTYGHHIGDAVLQHVANILRTAVRATDHVTRLGGEEFVALLPNTMQGTEVVAEKMRAAVADSDAPVVGRVTISVGVAVASCDDENEDKAVTQADRAMYAAKASGRNRVVLSSQ